MRSECVSIDIDCDYSSMNTSMSKIYERTQVIGCGQIDFSEENLLAGMS